LCISVTARPAEDETGDLAVRVVDHLEVGGVDETDVSAVDLGESTTSTSIEDSDKEEEFVGSSGDSGKIDVNFLVVCALSSLGVSFVENCAIFRFVVTNWINVVDELFVPEHEDSQIQIFVALPAETAEQFGDIRSDDDFFSFDGSEGLGERLFTVDGSNEFLVDE
jgi:hypothetical protein